MKPKLVDAVRQLVEAVLVEHCLPVAGDEGLWNEEHTIDCALAVFAIRAAEDFFAAQLGRCSPLRPRGRHVQARRK